MVNSANARSMAENFSKNGFKNTAKWITFSMENKDSPFLQDMTDIVNAFKIEFRFHRREFFDDPEFKSDCFEIIFGIIVSGMSTGHQKFRELTTKLVPLTKRLLENKKGTDSLVTDTQNLELTEAFHRFCNYYQMLWEGDYKLVRKNLLAMKRLREGKNVEITETLSIATDENTVETANALKEVTPERLKNEEYEHIRNAIAHYNFNFKTEEGKMEFWDINPRTQQYSWKPKKYNIEEFSRFIMEITLYCEAFSFAVLLIMVLTDLNKP
jgi:hypothetical protein